MSVGGSLYPPGYVMTFASGVANGDTVAGDRYAGTIDASCYLPGVCETTKGPSFCVYEYGGGRKNGLTVVPNNGVHKEEWVSFVQFRLYGSARTFWASESEVWASNVTSKAMGVQDRSRFHVFRPFVGEGSFDKNRRVGRWRIWLKSGEFRVVEFKDGHGEPHAHEGVRLVEGPYVKGEKGYESPPSVLEELFRDQSWLDELEQGESEELEKKQNGAKKKGAVKGAVKGDMKGATKKSEEGPKEKRLKEKDGKRRRGEEKGASEDSKQKERVSEAEPASVSSAYASSASASSASANAPAHKPTHAAHKPSYTLNDSPTMIGTSQFPARQVKTFASGRWRGAGRGRSVKGDRYVGGIGGDGLPGSGEGSEGGPFRVYEFGRGELGRGSKLEGHAIVPDAEAEGKEKVAFKGFLLCGSACTLWSRVSEVWETNTAERGVGIDDGTGVFRPFIGVGRFEKGARVGEWRVYFRNGEYRLVTFEDSRTEPQTHTAVEVIGGPHARGEKGYVDPPGMIRELFMDQSEHEEIERVKKGAEEHGSKRKRGPAAVKSEGEQEEVAAPASPPPKKKSPKKQPPTLFDRISTLRTSLLPSSLPLPASPVAALDAADTSVFGPPQPGNWAARATRLEVASRSLRARVGKVAKVLGLPGGPDEGGRAADALEALERDQSQEYDAQCSHRHRTLLKILMTGRVSLTFKIDLQTEEALTRMRQVRDRKIYEVKQQLNHYDHLI